MEKLKKFSGKIKSCSKNKVTQVPMALLTEGYMAHIDEEFKKGPFFEQ